MHQTQARRLYLKEFGGAMALYVAMVAMSVYAGLHFEPDVYKRQTTGSVPMIMVGTGPPARWMALARHR